jgi:Yip1 domain
MRAGRAVAVGAAAPFWYHARRGSRSVAEGGLMDLISRAKNILLSPNSEWSVIAGEETDVGTLYRSYIVIMAAIPPVCAFIGFSIFLGRFGIGIGFFGVIIQYVVALVVIYIVALIAQWLGPKFGGSGDFIHALKLVAYAATANWVGGFFMLVPFLSVLSLLLSLYGLYLLYAGAAPVMQVPKERAVVFTAALVLAVIIVFVVVAFILRAILGFGMMTMM